jgi:hypothetical protein
VESRRFARSSSALRVGLRLLPARLIKYVSIRNPEVGPLGDTLRDRRVRAIAVASFVNKPAGGCVESVFTFDTQRLEERLVLCPTFPNLPRMICGPLIKVVVLNVVVLFTHPVKLNSTSGRRHRPSRAGCRFIE